MLNTLVYIMPIVNWEDIFICSFEGSKTGRNTDVPSPSYDCDAACATCEDRAAGGRACRRSEKSPRKKARPPLGISALFSKKPAVRIKTLEIWRPQPCATA